MFNFGESEGNGYLAAAGVHYLGHHVLCIQWCKTLLIFSYLTVYSLIIIPDTNIQVEDVIAYKPNKIGEIWGCSPVPDVAQHGFVFHCNMK